MVAINWPTSLVPATTQNEFNWNKLRRLSLKPQCWPLLCCLFIKCLKCASGSTLVALLCFPLQCDRAFSDCAKLPNQSVFAPVWQLTGANWAWASIQMSCHCNFMIVLPLLLLTTVFAVPFSSVLCLCQFWWQWPPVAQVSLSPFFTFSLCP